VGMREKGKGMSQDGTEWKTYGGRWRILEMGQCGVHREPPIPDPPPPPLLKVEWQGGSRIQP
jgi:hypothetical protein